MEKEELKKKIDSILAKADLKIKKQEIADLEKQSLAPDFWSDSQNASKIMKKINDLKKEIEDIEMMQILFEENSLNEAEKLIKKYEVLLFLAGSYDQGDAIFSIHAG